MLLSWLKGNGDVNENECSFDENERGKRVSSSQSSEDDGEDDKHHGRRFFTTKQKVQAK